MSDYDNRNRGVLFRVDDDDKKSDRSPDLRGSLDVEGTEYWLSGWRKVSKNGVNYLSLSIQAKNADTAQPKKPAGGGARPQDFNDSIPF
jgi:hypothetical protein